jgi:hypothetical protein
LKSFKQLIKGIIERTGYTVLNARHLSLYEMDGLHTFHNSPFRQDADFRQAYNRGIQAAHGHDPKFEWRVHILLWAAAAALRVEGEFVECGVNAGFMSSTVMCRYNWNDVAKKYYLIDTFAGPVMEQFSAEELESVNKSVIENAIASGGYVTDISRVEKNFAEWKNAVIVKGVVPEVLSSLDISKVAFLHLDLNCAYPEIEAMNYFWDKLVAGGVVVLDDYSYHGYEAQTEAHNKFAATKGIPILCLPTGQGIIIKPY